MTKYIYKLYTHITKKYYITILVPLFCLTPQLLFGKNDIYKKDWIDLNKNGVKDVYENKSAHIDARIQDLLSQMTLEEKSCQLATLYGFGRVLKDSLPTERWNSEIWKDGIANIDEQLNGIGAGNRRNPHLTYPFSKHAECINIIQRWFIENTRLGIPVDFSNEGIHGLNHVKATPLPAPIGIGSTWNRELVHQAGTIVGKEAKLLGYTNVYAPILDVARDPRWGRIVESYGEDPYLISELGIKMAAGIQEQNVAATLKHFAAYSIPKGGRDAAVRTDPHISPRELHEIHLYPFKKVIQAVKPKGIMSSYNDWDGVPVTASHYFLTELLRQKYGFQGYVVSDSEAVEYVYSKHHVADTYQEAVRQVAEAGLNVRTNFSHPKNYILEIRQLVKDGKLSMKTVDRLVADVLRVKFELGLFDFPYVKNPKDADKFVGAELNKDFALKIQQQSLVLLKNDSQLLPLDRNNIQKILITGPLAKETNYMVSRYGPQKLENITVYDGIKSLCGKNIEIAYAKGCDVKDTNWPESELFSSPLSIKEQNDIDEAVKAAQSSDVIIAVLGEDENCVGESKSRTSLDLPGRQQLLLEALHKTGKPIVLVLINGRPLTINWANQYIPSILEAWFPGQQGGTAIAQTLFGDYNPGGHLTVTFPKSVGQIEYNFPYKPNSQAGQNLKGNNNGSGRTRVLGALYPFGHGLSYTTFEYSNLQIFQPTYNSQSPITIKVSVTNTGTRKGDEVVQLYIKDKISSVTTYESVLRGFERISLLPKETKTVTFKLNPEDLMILDKNMNWCIEPGEFEVMIGRSSEDIRISKFFIIN